MAHFTSWTDLVDPLWGASICAATAPEKPWSLIADAPGAVHSDLGLTDSWVESDWMVVWAVWARSVGFGRTWRLDPRIRACWATSEQSVWFSSIGSPTTSPPISPRWLLVGRRMGQDRPMAGWVHWLARPGCLALVTHTGLVCCWTSLHRGLFEISATVAYCLKDLWKERQFCLNCLA